MSSKSEDTKKAQPKNQPAVDGQVADETEQVFTKAEVEQISGELTADLQRIQAEFINYKRRAEDEKIQAINTGKQQAVIALLPVVDNIDRAIRHEPEDIKEHK